RAGVHTIVWDQLALDQLAEASPGPNPGPNSPAYVMYTSGTTGKPKGILVSQQNILKLAYENKDIAILPSDRVLQWSNYAFDGSVYDIFCTLLNGASLYLITKEQARDAAKLSEIITECELTACFITTALFNAFVDYEVTALKGLRKLLFGGQLVSVPHVKKALAAVGPNVLVHVYGPTETTVYATYYPINACDDSGIPIGRPLSNTSVFILDNAGHPAGIGIVGEICIAGDGVAMGYLNQPELTAEKFIPNTYNSNGKYFYKTGDYGKWLADGSVDFIGRKDDQVKVRGYRIELGEIESVLQRAPGVKQCAVTASANEGGSRKLVGYVVGEGPHQAQAWQTYLKEKLPDYMVPAVIVEINQLPLTSNGKVDKKALPDPATLLNNPEDAYEAPTTVLEQHLASIWQKLLSVERVGVQDNFFELGGDSIITIQVASRLKRLGYSLQPHQVFENPTIAQLAQVIAAQENQTTGEQGLLTGEVGLLPVQQWFLSTTTQSLSHFNQDMLLGIPKSIPE
ncbi:MAG TPA: AMP-binding protein, partial [Hymenobacter sp.]|nr:AMP-binding protein [Hymenobacter sp.]